MGVYGPPNASLNAASDPVQVAGAAGDDRRGDDLRLVVGVQLGDQALAALVTPLYAFGMTYVLLRVMGLFTSLRASENDEAVGMDVVQHGEEAYPSGEGAILVLPDADGEILVADPQVR